MDPGTAENLQQGGRGATLFQTVGGIRLGWFNPGMALVAGMSAWLAYTLWRRSVDDWMVAADQAGLTIRNIGRNDATVSAWQRIASVKVERADDTSVLTCALGDGGHILVKGIDRDENARRHFLAYANARITPPS